MKAADVMVSDVITVRLDASVQEVAELLLGNGISAVPVVGGRGELLGIVSEGDLMRRVESATEHRRSWWLEALSSRETLAAEFVKSHSRRVADVMTRDVFTAGPDTPLRDIAELLEKRSIKRVPIVHEGKVVGIVSRANLLQAVVSLRKGLETVAEDDAALRKRVLGQLRTQTWTRPMLLNVIARDGTVELWGSVDSESERRAVLVAAEITPGVRAVYDHLTLRLFQTGA